VLGQNGEGALRHGPITDEQDFVFKFQHGKNVLARNFVRIFFALQEFIEKRTLDVESDSRSWFGSQQPLAGKAIRETSPAG
jgi:hypothetical protein